MTDDPRDDEHDDLLSDEEFKRICAIPFEERTFEEFLRSYLHVQALGRLGRQERQHKFLTLPPGSDEFMRVIEEMSMEERREALAINRAALDQVAAEREELRERQQEILLSDADVYARAVAGVLMVVRGWPEIGLLWPEFAEQVEREWRTVRVGHPGLAAELEEDDEAA